MGGCRTDGSDIDSVDPVPLYGITKQELQEDYFDEQEDDFDEDFDEESGCAIYSVSKIFSITNLALNEQFDFFFIFCSSKEKSTTPDLANGRKFPKYQAQEQVCEL